jgi:hypothetical protein
MEMPSGSILWNTGDVWVDGLISGAYDGSSQFWLLNVDSYTGSDARTISIHNPQSIQLGGVAGGIGNEGGSGNGIVPANGVVLKLTYTYSPAISQVGIDAVDLNFVAPGGTVEDFGFPWDWNVASYLPQVWAVLDGVLVTAEVSIAWLSDNQWKWSFTLPGGAIPGQSLMVTTARDDGAGNWREQQLRASVQLPWATYAQAEAIEANTHTSVNTRVVTWTQLDTSENPEVGVMVWASSSETDPTQMTGSVGITNSSGIAIFTALVGTAYIFRLKVGVSFAFNPIQVTIAT